MKILFFLSLALSLSACATSTREHWPKQELWIDTTLTIEADSASIDLQAGKIKTPSSINQYKPHCRFVMQHISSEPRLLKPGRFDISRVRYNIDYVSLPIRIFNASLLGSFSDSLTAVDYFTIFELRSSEQPDLIRLDCSHWEDPEDAEHLTLKQINNALGHYAHIKRL